MKKYFFISDTHSFYSAMIDALCKAGFELNNPEHYLVVCGDVFDRGEETKEVYDFFMNIPKERRVMIKGNHEYLYLALLDKEKPDYYDFSNGTVKTFCHVAGVDYDCIKERYYDSIGAYFDKEWFAKDFNTTWARVVKEVKKSQITKWLKSDEWINFFELGKYIAVHSWVPTTDTPVAEIRESDKAFFYATGIWPQVLMKDWREKATAQDWEEATWGCPWRHARDNQNPEGKIIICGHWHASDFHVNLGFEPDGEDNYNIYFGKNVVALDACTARTGFCNVLVIDEEFNCFDQFGNKLEVKESEMEAVWKL